MLLAVSQATAPMEMGEETLCCRGCNAIHVLTCVPHRDATAAMRSLQLSSGGEATSPTDLNGTGEGVLWHHSHHLQGLGGSVTPASLEEVWQGGKELGGPK